MKIFPLGTCVLIRLFKFSRYSSSFTLSVKNFLSFNSLINKSFCESKTISLIKDSDLFSISFIVLFKIPLFISRAVAVIKKLFYKFEIRNAINFIIYSADTHSYRIHVELKHINLHTLPNLRKLTWQRVTIPTFNIHTIYSVYIYISAVCNMNIIIG